jgi:hypothetical protein
MSPICITPTLNSLCDVLRALHGKEPMVVDEEDYSRSCAIAITKKTAGVVGH